MTVETATTGSVTELTDSELLSRYGPFLEGAIVAYRNDPTYLVEMVEKASVIVTRREHAHAAKDQRSLPAA